MVDTLDSGSSGSNPVEVRVLSAAPTLSPQLALEPNVGAMKSRLGVQALVEWRAQRHE